MSLSPFALILIGTDDISHTVYIDTSPRISLSLSLSLSFILKVYQFGNNIVSLRFDFCVNGMCRERRKNLITPD